MPTTQTPPATPTVIDSPAALAALVIDCRARGLPLVDYGIAHAGLGNPPPPEHVRLVQRGTILEHYVSDLTVRAAAGITLGDLQKALRPTGQFVPIDTDDDLTLGEVINHNVYNSLRVGYGSIRDLLLGLHYIDGDGRDIHVGGRTVKNVAGYDVTRLMVGSLGELGVIHEATLRTYAIPETVMMVDVQVKDPAVLDAILPEWLLADAAPSGLELSNQTGQWMARVTYHGRTAACAAQLRSLETILEAVPETRLQAAGYASLEQSLSEATIRRAWRRRAGALLKIVVPPTKTGAACDALTAAASDHPKLSIDALPVHGCLFVGGPLNAEAAAALDHRADEVIAGIGGFRVWYARPAGCEALPPFAPPQPDWHILQSLKRTMDPRNLFNPGRLLVSSTVSESPLKPVQQ